MNSLLDSQLYDEHTFYQTFLKDVESVKVSLLLNPRISPLNG